ncbi:MAG: TolC family protein [Acidobacteria bacterium]|nr:TolC family protein [Acidobacteriota bacterium]
MTPSRIVAVVVVLASFAAPSAAQIAPPGDLSILESFVGELERNNPELKATRREIDMRTARIAPAGAPPDPSLSFGYMSGFLRPPFFPSARTPDGARQFGLSQELPFPGKLALRSTVAATEADAARWNSEDVRVRLVAELKASYFDYVLADRSLGIIARNKQLLEQVRDIAESQFRVGKVPQQDVLKAQLEISMLLERAAMLEQERTRAQAALNGLLYRAPDTPVEMQATFDAAVLSRDVQQLRAMALERYPGLRRDEQLIQRGQQGLQLARKEVLPDFAVNVTTQKLVGGMPWTYGVDVMVKVPLFWQRKQRPMIAEAAAALDAGRRMRENTLAQTQSAVTQAHVMASTAERLTQLYTDSILPQARLTLESSIAAYQVGAADFLTLLMNVTAVLANELNLEQQQAQYRRALAELEPYVGTTLIR